MPLLTPLPPALDDRPFLVAEALALGVSRKRLRASDLRAPFHGVRVSKGLGWSTALRARCALLVAPEGSVIAGVDAVVVAGLPLPFGAPDPLDAEPVVAVRAGVARPRVAGLRVRAAPLAPGTARWRQAGVLRAAVEDVWAERCADLDAESAVALGDAALRQLRGDRDALAAAVERLPVTDRRRARDLLTAVRFEVCSPVETRLRWHLLLAGVPQPSHFAAPIPRDGTAQAWPDLQWESVRVAVEVDGSHHREPDQHDHDLGRDRRIRALGWSLVVVSGRQVVADPGAAVALVAAELRAAGLRW